MSIRQNDIANIKNVPGETIMLLADTSTVTVVQHVGTILHDLFGGDYPEEPLGILQIAVRAVFVYSATLLIVRVGKSRIISRTTTIDVILGFILGSLISRAVTGSASITGTIMAAGALVLAHWVFTAMAYRYHWFGVLLKGDSHLVVENGKPLQRWLRHSHISAHDLVEEMRLAGIGDLQQVHEAFKERNGQISFIRRPVEPRVLEVAVQGGVQTVRIALE
jgi:uncharacterized membrane protein YcaP (DUF421 family)